MDLLLEAGAAPDAAARDGATPLLLAAEAGCAHCVQSLLRRGADADAADAAGATPLLAALAGGHGRTAEALLEAGAKTRGRLGERAL